MLCVSSIAVSPSTKRKHVNPSALMAGSRRLLTGRKSGRGCSDPAAGSARHAGHASTHQQGQGQRLTARRQARKSPVRAIPANFAADLATRMSVIRGGSFELRDAVYKSRVLGRGTTIVESRARCDPSSSL